MPKIAQISSTEQAIINLQATISALEHFSSVGLEMRHYKLLLSAILYIMMHEKPPTKKQIAEVSGVKGDISPYLNDLVAKRYLHEDVPTYGRGAECYKIGSVGGTLIRKMRVQAKRTLEEYDKSRSKDAAPTGSIRQVGSR